MIEPVSTITNAAFIIFGLIIFRRSWFVGLTTVLLGIASAGWHWTLQPFWHTFDLGMMYFMLLSLMDFSAGSEYTREALLTGVGVVGIHFLLPSQMIIGAIAFLLLLVLIRHYPPGRILIIVACFTLWISTNIPYLHQWNLPFWQLDVLHGISHICAAIGIYKAVNYKPVTFSELATAFKSIHLGSLKAASRTEFERIIDLELNPVLGKRPVAGLHQQDISRLLDNVATSEGSLKMTEGVRSMLDQILDFARDRGIEHNLVAENAAAET